MYLLRRLILLVVISCMGMSFLFLSARSAIAGVNDYPPQWKNVRKDSVIDSWRLYNRECTSFSAFRLSSRNGFQLSPAYGNAGAWGSHAIRDGYAVNMTPAVGAIAWWSTISHVAWVEAVNGSQVTIEEYNYSPPYQGQYSERTIASNSVSGYIHFRDINVPLPPPTDNRPYPVMALDAVPQVGYNTDGTLAVLMRGSDNAIWDIRQSSPNGGWNQWEKLGGYVSGNPVVGRWPDGHLEFFVRGTDGIIYNKWQNGAGGAWSTQWGDMGGGGNVASDPVFCINQDGRAQLFYRGKDNNIYTRFQNLDGRTWSDWQNFGNNASLDPAIGMNADGNLELFARGLDSSIYSRTQMENSESWDVWRNHNCGVAGKPVIGTYARDGRLILLVRGTDGVTYYTEQEQNASTGSWSNWDSFGNPFPVATNPAVVTNSQGFPQAFVRGYDNAIYTMAINSDSPVWYSLGGGVTSDPAAGVNANGEMVVFVVGTDGLMYQRRQVFGVGWAPWDQLR